jgi:DNA polymerase delta subunit 1
MVMRENLFGFQGNQKNPYLKITVTDPKHINELRTAFEKGNANYKNLWKGADDGILTFDSIQYILRFMIDTGVRIQIARNSLGFRIEVNNREDFRDVVG